jgi:excisionase family DNA binding protein
MPKIDINQLMTVREVAAELGSTRAGVYALIERGRLTKTIVGGKILISRANLDKLELSAAGAPRGPKTRREAPEA